MARMSQLDLTVKELRAAAQSLIGVADSLSELFSGKSDDAPEKAKPPTPAKPEVTLENVRAVLAEKSRNGHTAAVKALLGKYGAAKLSDVTDAEILAAILADAEGIA